jgi:hypothetical protein
VVTGKSRMRRTSIYLAIDILDHCATKVCRKGNPEKICSSPQRNVIEYLEEG